MGIKRRSFWGALLGVFCGGIAAKSAVGKPGFVTEEGGWQVLRVPLAPGRVSFGEEYVNAVCDGVREILTHAEPGTRMVIEWRWREPFNVERVLTIKRVRG